MSFKKKLLLKKGEKAKAMKLPNSKPKPKSGFQKLRHA